MLRVSILAASHPYQLAAARAAATYVCVMRSAARVSVLVPRALVLAPELESAASDFGFSIQTFDLNLDPSYPLVTQAKCRAFVEGLARIEPGDLLLAVDADTFCHRFIDLDEELRAKILGGGVGMVQDIQDHHSDNPGEAWFVPPQQREPYANAGVVLAGRGAADIFQRVWELLGDPAFRFGAFYDQTVINYALSREFPGRLVLMDKRYNGMRPYFDDHTLIGHCAGGAGGLSRPGSTRKAEHERHCARIIAAARLKELAS